MPAAAQPVIATAKDRPRETWDDPSRGDVAWFTLLSADRTPTTSMSAGIAEFAPRGGFLAPHRHAEAEIYHVLDGTGVLTIDGTDHAIAAGVTVFIPGNAEHAVRNVGDAVLKILYIFPAASFAEIVYRFS